MSRIARLAAVMVLAQGACGESLAAGACASRDEMTTLRVAAFQQQLMVAALTCHDVDDYNNFVTSYQSDLQRSDRALLELFVSKDGASGDAEYNAFKTRLANLASMRSIRHQESFCRQAERQFDRALGDDNSLSGLVWSAPISARMPFQDCDDETLMADASRHDRPHYRRTHWRAWYDPQE